MNQKLKIEFDELGDSEICRVSETRQGLINWLETTPPNRQGEFIADIDLCSNYDSHCSQIHIWEAIAQRTGPTTYQVVSLEIRTPTDVATPKPPARITTCGCRAIFPSNVTHQSKLR